MILFLLLPALEKIINQALKSDTHAVSKLAAIENQIIEIHCVDWKIKFYIVAAGNELQFEKKVSREADAVVAGTMDNFFHLFMKGADTAAGFQHPIDIRGNMHTVEILRDTFKNLDIDFEEKLSNYLGDTLSHKIFSHVHATKKILQNTKEKLVAQFKEYIYFETKNFPTKENVERFYEDIATLRNDVDRLEARIAKYL